MKAKYFRFYPIEENAQVNTIVTNKVKFEKTLTCVALAISLLMSACSSGGEEKTTGNTLDTIKKRNKIIIGVKTDNTPYGFIDKNGKNAGLEIDIAKYITNELLGSQEKVEFVSVVASNRIEFLKQGKIDLVIATMTKTPEREKIIDFSEEYYSAGTGLLTHKDSGVKSWDNLRGKKVCGIQGSFYNKALAEKGIQMVNFPGTAEAYKALEEKRCIGLAYDDSALVGKLLDPSWGKNWHQPLPVIFEKPWGMGIRKNNQPFLDAVNAAITKMEAEGFIVDGEKKWKIPPTEHAKKRMKKAQSQK